MGVRQNRNVTRQQIDYGIGARNEQLAHTSRPIALALAKAQARINHNALQCDTRKFYYFRRRRAGRLCSCVLGNESTPSSKCQICYNTGYVGGYDKYGTATEVLDVTTPGLVLMNVHANYESGTRPVFFALDDGARLGTVQATLPLRRNAGYVDIAQVYSNAVMVPGSTVDVLCRPHGSNTWLQFTTSVLEGILQTQSCDELDVIIYIKRKSFRSESPLVSHVYLRYGLFSRQKSLVLADIPKHSETVTGTEYGFNEEFGSLSMFVDNTIVTYSIDDFFYHLDKKKFWHIQEVQPNISMDICLNTDITARFMQNYEIATLIPL